MYRISNLSLIPAFAGMTRERRDDRHIRFYDINKKRVQIILMELKTLSSCKDGFALQQ